MPRDAEREAALKKGCKKRMVLQAVYLRAVQLITC